MKKIILALAILTTASDLSAQVAKRVFLEHHTNTRCGNCASRNPDLKANVANNSDVLYMSIHPSSPYASCIFSQHNKADNDGRTNYNGVFGATPRIVINGTRSTLPFSSNVLFSPYQNLTTEIDLKSEIEYHGTDSIKVSVEIETVASHSYGSELLFVALVEGTVNYNAPNGETEHTNVLRKALTDASGDAISLPVNVGEKSSLEFYASIHSEWNASRMKAIVVVQKAADRDLIQGDDSESLGTAGGPNLLSETTKESSFKVFPNPASDQIILEGLAEEPFEYRLLNARGQLLVSGSSVGRKNLKVTNLNRGLYFIELRDQKNIQSQRVVLQ